MMRRDFILLQARTRQAARRAGIELVSLSVKATDDIASAPATAENREVPAIIVAADPLTGYGCNREVFSALRDKSWTAHSLHR